MRIQRALARAGIASRRKAEELVAAGRVQVNGAVAKTGQSVAWGSDRITVDGQAIPAPAAPRWLVLNKPPGVLTTARDPEGRKTVFDLVPAAPGLTYVGRLDYMTEGVLLLTTDGDAQVNRPSGLAIVTKSVTFSTRSRYHSSDSASLRRFSTSTCTSRKIETRPR